MSELGAQGLKSFFTDFIAVTVDQPVSQNNHGLQIWDFIQNIPLILLRMVKEGLFFLAQFMAIMVL